VNRKSNTQTIAHEGTRRDTKATRNKLCGFPFRRLKMYEVRGVPARYAFCRASYGHGPESDFMRTKRINFIAVDVHSGFCEAASGGGEIEHIVRAPRLR
jgi:hypothetical protein